MFTRSLTPFLISFAVFAAIARSPVQAADDAGAHDAARVQLLAQLARDLSTHFNAEGELALETFRPWTLPTTAPAAEWTATLTEFPSTLSSTLLLRVRLSAPGQASRDDTLTCRAQLLREAFVVSTPVERGARVDPSSLETRRVDALRERDLLPPSLGDAAGELVFNRPVPSGRLVTWRDVVRRALVRKGEVIDVAAVDGPLQVMMKGLAMQDGAQGETVRVRNLESKREFPALVVAEKSAQVRF